ncbi:MAG: sodium-dependent bicarbonate transport family permease [Wenzhouxiangella sp.]|nr:sodium-dependent bicarbonate transport family permease [Wenzhouxiangella sp.]
MLDLFLTNFLSPPVLFFFLGGLAVMVKSDLGIPGQISKFLSLYLLFAIGFKGGVALVDGPPTWLMGKTLAFAMTLSALVPLILFQFAKHWFNRATAAAIAATYGSISAVTFIAATGYLDRFEIQWDGYMVAAMALMEAPAIIVGILLYYAGTSSSIRWKTVLHESALNGSVFLIMGSMLIGALTGQQGMQQVSPFVVDLFAGLLCLFLLDMGIRAYQELKSARQLFSLKEYGLMIITALITPVIGATLATFGVLALGIGEGNGMLLIVLAASASYIAVPAAMRLAIPDAQINVYLPMSLAITFPFNLLVGIPIYHALATWAQ